MGTKRDSYYVCDGWNGYRNGLSINIDNCGISDWNGNDLGVRDSHRDRNCVSIRNRRDDRNRNRDSVWSDWNRFSDGIRDRSHRNSVSLGNRNYWNSDSFRYGSNWNSISFRYGGNWNSIDFRDRNDGIRVGIGVDFWYRSNRHSIGDRNRHSHRSVGIGNCVANFNLNNWMRVG